MNNPILSAVTIGEGCFNGENEKGFIVSKCDSLISLTCPSSSLVNTKSLSFSDLPSLSLLHFYPNCFPNAMEFCISNCSSLCHIDIPNKSFSKISKLLISSLSALTRIRFGSTSCVGIIGFLIHIQSNHSDYN